MWGRRLLKEKRRWNAFDCRVWRWRVPVWWCLRSWTGHQGLWNSARTALTGLVSETRFMSTTLLQLVLWTTGSGQRCPRRLTVLHTALSLLERHIFTPTPKRESVERHIFTPTPKREGVERHIFTPTPGTECEAIHCGRNSHAGPCKVGVWAMSWQR